jgi:death-on-curing protein
MKKEPHWISKKALLMLHEEAIAEFGGGRGMRDEALLDSALARPQHLYTYNPDATLAELVASCAYGIAKNHAFVDGNKRAAFLAIGMMLGVNGQRLVASQLDAIQTVTAVASGELSEEALALWVKKHSEAKQVPRKDHEKQHEKQIEGKSRFLTKTKPSKPKKYAADRKPKEPENK